MSSVPPLALPTMRAPMLLTRLWSFCEAGVVFGVCVAAQVPSHGTPAFPLSAYPALTCRAFLFRRFAADGSSVLLFRSTSSYDTSSPCSDFSDILMSFPAFEVWGGASRSEVSSRTAERGDPRGDRNYPRRRTRRSSHRPGQRQCGAYGSGRPFGSHHGQCSRRRGRGRAHARGPDRRQEFRPARARGTPAPAPPSGTLFPDRSCRRIGESSRRVAWARQKTAPEEC